MRSSKASKTETAFPAPCAPGASGRASLSPFQAICALLVLAPLLLPACLASSAGHPGGGGQPESQGPAMDLALGLRRGGESIGSFAARGSVEYSADGSNHFFRFELLSQRPGNFQFTVLDPLGRPAMRVISDGSRFVALQYGAREATVGPADPGSLGRFLPLGLRAEDFISLLSGTLVPVPEAAALDPGPRNGQTLRILPGGFWSGASWKVSLSSAENGQRIDGFTATMADGPPLVAGYGQFAVLPVEDAGLRVDFPHRLDLSWGREKKLLIRYDEVRLGFPAQPGMFLPLVPAGFSRVEL